MALDRYDTLPKVLVRNAQQYGDSRTAIREKEYGIWQSYSWPDYLKQVREFTLGLVSLGFQPGDKLAIIGDNRPQLYWAMVGAMACGGYPVPIYQDAIAQEMRYVLDHSESKIVVAEDQEQTDKILDLKDQLPKIEWVIYDDPKGLRSYQVPYLLSFIRVQEMGRELEKKQPKLFDEMVARATGDDLAVINYTSGTTGVPKGVMLTHRNLLENGKNLLKVDPWYEGDEVMAYLPMAWIGDTYFSVVLSFLSGAKVNCSEEAITVQRDLREIGPTLTFAPPRIWENMVRQLEVKLEDADWVKKKLARFFLAVGSKTEELKIKKEPVPWHLKLFRILGEPLVYGPLRDHLGLRRMRIATTGGAALGWDVFLLFRGMGVNLKEIYGLTESSAACTLQKDGDVKLDSVGPPLPGVEIKITPEGEILLKSPGIFPGYYKNPEATAQALRDGWLATGDAGFIDPDGHLVIVDRAKDVSRLMDGTVFAPQYIENKLKFSLYIREAVAVGQDKPFVVAMINMDMGTVGNWAEKKGIPFAGYPDLSQKPEVYDLIHKELQRVNRFLNPEVRVKRFVVLHKELDPDDAEITRTRKLRRRFIAEKYADITDALYSGAPEVRVKAKITYEDGRTAEVERSVRVREVEPVEAMAGRKR